MTTRRELLVLCPIPPELEGRLSIDYDLRYRSEADGQLSHQVAVTMSVAGIDAAAMDRLPNLGLVICNGTGLDRIDLVSARQRGIIIENTPDEVTEDTADFGIALIYATLRKTVEADRFVRAGRWGSERFPPSRRVFSRHVGLVGMGNIGKIVARRAAAIGMQVSYTARSPKPDLPYAFKDNVLALAEAVEVLVLCCSGGPETTDLVDEAVLAALGAEGYLINISRGSVVNQPALLTALEERRIAGAGIDVYANEPNIDARFMALDNVVLTPHYAAATTETRHAMADRLHAAVGRYYAAR
jgi:hydroxypyruvate reductase